MGSIEKPQLQRVPRTTPTSDIHEVVLRDGGVIIEGFVTPEQVSALNKDIDPQMDLIGAGSTRDDEFTKDFHGLETKRLTNLVTHSKVFRDAFLNDSKTHELSEAMFEEASGTYWMSTAQIIEIGPGNKAQPLHRDLENVYPAIKAGPTGPEVSINFLIALVDSDEDNGATRVIPGSCNWPDFTDRGLPEQTVPAELKAGDCLFIGGKVVHGGGHNQSIDRRRRVLAFTFVPSYITPEEAYPFMVDLAVAKTMTPRAQTMIGYQSQYPKGSPGLWQKDYQNINTMFNLPLYTA